MKALAMLLMLAGTAVAQEARPGAILGVVTNAATGAPVAGVTVVVTEQFARPVSAITDDNGFYRLTALPPADLYVVTFAENGAIVDRDEVVVEAGKTTLVDADIAVAPPPSEPSGGFTITEDYCDDCHGWPGEGRTFENVLGAAAMSQRDVTPSTAIVGPAVRHRRHMIDTHATELVFRSTDLGL